MVSALWGRAKQGVPPRSIKCICHMVRHPVQLKLSSEKPQHNFQCNQTHAIMHFNEVNREGSRKTNPTEPNRTQPPCRAKGQPTHTLLWEWVGGATLWAVFTHNICKTSQNLASTAGATAASATAASAAASEAKHFSLWAKCN